MVCPVGSSDTSGANDAELARCEARQGGQHWSRQWHQVRKLVRVGAQDDDPQRTPAQILLEAEALVHGEEGVEPGLLGGPQQWPVVQIGPPPVMDRLHSVAGQERAEGPRQVAVQEDAHGPLDVAEAD